VELWWESGGEVPRNRQKIVKIMHKESTERFTANTNAQYTLQHFQGQGPSSPMPASTHAMGAGTPQGEN